MRTFRPRARAAAHRLATPSAVALLAIAGTGAAFAAPAQAAFDRTLTFSCIYPYVGDVPVRLAIAAGYEPSQPISGQPFALRVASAATLGPEQGVVVGASAVDVRSLTMTVSTGPLRTMTGPVQRDPVDGSYGSTLRFPQTPGNGHDPFSTILTSIGFTLIFRDVNGAAIPIDADATSVPQTDADPNTVQVSCSLAPATQDARLASTVFGDPTPPPPSPTPTPTPTPTVVPDPTPTPTVMPTPTPTPTAEPEPTTTPEPTATPTPTEQLVPYSYALAGTASLKTLTKGSLPLSGGIDAKLGIPSGKFTGDLTLAPSTGNLTALGFLPVTAKVNLVPTEQVTGTLKDGKLTAVAKVRIKLPSVKTFGIELAGGANCQAKQISSITLTSTQPTFLPLSGGPIAGTFSISDLSGCGFLTGIVSPLTSGSGNLIALNLTPKAA